MEKKNKKDIKRYKKIIIYGFMTAGKSSIGKLVAKRLLLPFYDTDVEFEKIYSDIGSFIKKNGMRRFRDIEKQIFLSLRSKKETSVIACGGGILPRGDRYNLEVFLNPCWEVIEKRLAKNTEKRPLLSDFPDSRDRIKKLYNKRLEGYMKASLEIKETDMRKIVDKIIDIYEDQYKS
jgi:shikimate kinase